MLLTPEDSGSHLLMMPNTDEVGSAVSKAVGMMLCAPEWHVSLQLPPIAVAVVESSVNLSVVKYKGQVPFLKGQLSVMACGLAVDKNIKAESPSSADASGAAVQAATPDVSEEDQLAPFHAPAAVPAAKLLPFAKRAAQPASSSHRNTAPPSTVAASQLEKDRQTRSSVRDKRQKEAEQSRPAAEEKPTKKIRKTRSSKPAAEKSKKYAFMGSDSETS